MVEYSGMSFAVFFLAEYANMILLSALAVIMFLGGWAAPINLELLLGVDFPNWLDQASNWFWLIFKTFVVVSMFIWFRASFPRYRYDQIMRLGWKVFIPITLAWLIVVAVWMQTPWNIWKQSGAGTRQSGVIPALSLPALTADSRLPTGG
jgi:NADH-quinone oxidoreductase subunit H